MAEFNTLNTRVKPRSFRIMLSIPAVIAVKKLLIRKLWQKPEKF